MFDFLKDHPFAVEAYFEHSIVLTFAVPKEALSALIPDCLTLDTFQDQWAFIAMAMVQTKGLRPKGTSKFMGNDFFLIGYRVFVRYTNQEGKRLRGLYILKSETDKKKMTFLGNIFTHYNYTTTDIQQIEGEESIEISSVQSRFHLVLDKRENNINLPEDSPFLDWKEARRYAGPLPFTFTYNEDSRQILIIEGVRQNWTPNPIQIKNYQFDYLKTLHFNNPILANAFIIKNIPYYWKKGKKEQWK